MANARRIVIEFLGKDKSLGSTADSAESKTSKLGGTLKKVGLIAGGALAAGAIVAGKALFDMAKGAAEDAKGQATLAKTLQNTTGATKGQIAAVEDWISKQGVALGVTDDELRPALDRLVRSTKDVGEAQRLASLAMNISAGTGKSLKTVSEALGKAYDGNTGGLGRLGIATKDAEGKALSFDQVVKNASQTFKGQAATAANTFEGKMGRLKLVFDEAKESLGAKLLPILTDLGTWFLRKGLPALQKFGGWLGDHVLPVLAKLGDFIRTRVIPAAQAFASWFIDKIAPGLKRTVAPILDGIRGYFEKIANKVQENRPQLEKLMTAFKRIVEFIAQKVMPILGKLVGEGFEVVGTTIGIVIDAVSKLVDFFDNLIGKVKDFIGAVGGIHLPDLNPFREVARGGTPTAGRWWAGVPKPGIDYLANPVGEFVDMSKKGGGHHRRVGSNDRGVTVVVNFNGVVGDKRAVAREIATLLREEIRLSGSGLGLT